MQQTTDPDVSAHDPALRGHDPDVYAHHERAARRDSLARTGPLFAVLLPMLLVYGLAVLAGWTTSTGALIGALVLLVVVTYGVVAGTVHMINLPPEDGEEQQEISARH